jgi:hypothetical protein
VDVNRAAEKIGGVREEGYFGRGHLGRRAPPDGDVTVVFRVAEGAA